MKTLDEIIEELKTNGKPEYEDLRYSVLVLVGMLNMDHINLRNVLMSEKELSPLVKKLKAENSFSMYKTALNKPPKEYLGWNNDPENPEYQKFHALGLKILDKVMDNRDK